jgi:ubiquitin-protein ligase E3 A
MGSVRCLASAFMRPPAPPGQLAFAALEALMVRCLSLGLRRGGGSEVVSALCDAAAKVAAELVGGWRSAVHEEHAAALCALLQLPLLSTERLAAPLLTQLLPLVSAASPRLRELLLAGWAVAPAALLASRTCRPLQSFLTAELRAAGSTTDLCVATVRTLALLEEANRRRNEPVAAEELYNDFVSTHLNVQEDFTLWAGNKAAFTFCAHPFLLSPVAKARLLRFEAAMSMAARVQEARHQQAAQEALAFALPPESPRWLRFLSGELGGQPPPSRRMPAVVPGRLADGALPPDACGIPATLPDWCVLRVRRRSLVADALAEVARQHREDLLKPLRVYFIGEEGVDAGGLKKELFLLLIDELMKPEQRLFCGVASGRLRWIEPDGGAGSMGDDAAQHRWRLVGSLLGLAIYNGVILELHLPQAFFRKLLGAPVSLAHLEEFEPEVARSLRAVLTWSGPGSVEDTFGLTFTALSGVELVEGGSQIAVTEANRERYVSLAVDHALNRVSARAFDALRASFMALCGGLALRLVSPAELEVLVCGTPHLDFHALRTAAHYDGGWDEAHPTIRNFWQVITDQFSLDEQKAFLRFVTGSDRAPIGGLSQLPILISREDDSNRLPTSHTCFSQLCLPEYGSRGKLADRLRTACINAAEGFGLV